MHRTRGNSEKVEADAAKLFQDFLDITLQDTKFAPFILPKVDIDNMG